MSPEGLGLRGRGVPACHLGQDYQHLSSNFTGFGRACSLWFIHCASHVQGVLQYSSPLAVATPGMFVCCARYNASTAKLAIYMGLHMQEQLALVQLIPQECED